MADKVAIIGTREPSLEQAEFAYALTQRLLRDTNVIISTGGQPKGIDGVAMKAVGDMDMGSRLYLALPWAGFGGPFPSGATTTIFTSQKDWQHSVTTFHPNPNALSAYAYRLHARNFGIVVNALLTVALPNAQSSGGTGQSIRICRGLKIPLKIYPKGSPIPKDEVDRIVKAVASSTGAP